MAHPFVVVEPVQVRIGVLALQGAFAEHVEMLHSIPASGSAGTASGSGSSSSSGGSSRGRKTALPPPQRACLAREVRTPAELVGLHGLILPGGESTAMHILGRENGMWDSLREWVRDGRPIWGTCAGMILLSDALVGQKLGGQGVIGGLDVVTRRNYFGSQVRSFQCALRVPRELLVSGAFGSASTNNGCEDGGDAAMPYMAHFIRAPAIVAVGPRAQIICTVPRPADDNDGDGAAAAGGGGRCSGFASAGDAAANGPARSLVPRVVPGLLKPAHGVDQRTIAGEGGAHDGNDDDTAAAATAAAPPAAPPVVEFPDKVVVAVQQGNLLATSFHPELGSDTRWHRHFVAVVQAAAAAAAAATEL